MKSSSAEDIPVASMIDDLLKDAFPNDLKKSFQNLPNMKYPPSIQDYTIPKNIQISNNISSNTSSKKISQKSIGSLFDVSLDDEKELVHQVNSVEPCVNRTNLNLSQIYTPEPPKSIRSFRNSPPQSEKGCSKKKIEYEKPQTDNLDPLNENSIRPKTNRKLITDTINENKQNNSQNENSENFLKRNFNNSCYPFNSSTEPNTNMNLVRISKGKYGPAVRKEAPEDSNYEETKKKPSILSNSSLNDHESTPKGSQRSLDTFIIPNLGPVRERESFDKNKKKQINNLKKQTEKSIKLLIKDDDKLKALFKKFYIKRKKIRKQDTNRMCTETPPIFNRDEAFK